MNYEELLVSIVVGALQGVVEWLPISSEGAVSLALAVFFARPAADAVRLALFLHVGTAFAATAYYRGALRELLAGLSAWRPGEAFDDDAATFTFLGGATLISGVVALAAYAGLSRFVTAVGGGAFVVLVGVLLLLTGAFERFTDRPEDDGHRDRPDAIDAVLVGALQGLAILPGISRSGVTAGALLLRGHDGPAAFRLSFLLSIPAALGAGLLVVVDAGELPAVDPASALVALATSAAVGYLAIGALMRLVARVSFWAVCLGLGGLAVVGGGLLLV